MRSERIRVAVADDHPIFRLGVRSLLAPEPDIDLVAEAEDGEAAVALVNRVHPDVLLLDLNLPVMNGLDVLRQLEADAADTRTVLVSAAVEPAQMRAAVLHGAYGVLLKHTASELLVRCIRQVAAGDYFLAPGEVGALVRAIRAPHGTAPGVLTPRELDIVRGVVKGLSNKEIASSLDISEQTVKNYLRNIFEKLNVGNRVELAMLAVERGLADRPG